MNAAARALVQGGLTSQNPLAKLINRQTIALVLLCLMLVSSAFAVVTVRDANRRMFGELQSLQHDRDQMHTEWRQLLLEQSTYATQARVQKVANEQLGMRLPNNRDIVMLVVANQANPAQ